MSNKRAWADVALLLAAAVWGFGFVPQRSAMQVIGPFTFSASRFAIGTLALLPLVLWRRRHKPELGTVIPETSRISTLAAGAILGLLIFGGASLQQIGLIFTTAGKAGFITGLYVVLVPILLAVFWRKPPGWNAWLGICLAVPGLYLLSIQSGFQLAPGDTWELAGSFVWALHLIAIARLAPGRDPVLLAFLQFLVCGLISFFPALAFESHTWQLIGTVWPGIVYAGAVSIGVGFTLQMTSQRYTPPADAAIILCLEAVFGAFFGWLVLGEIMTPRMVLGAGLMFCGMLAAQIPQIAQIAHHARRQTAGP